MTNDQLAAMLAELAELTKLADQNPQSFRARAYESAARALTVLDREAASMSAGELAALPGIGKSTAAKIREAVETGRIEKLEELRSLYPPEFREVVRIPGIGPKTAHKLRDELGVQNLADLDAALSAQAVRRLPGLGAKTEEKIAAAIERLGMSGKERRTPIAAAMAEARRISGALAELPAAERIEVCGSLRRLRETVADVDIVVASRKPTEVMAAVAGMPEAHTMLAAGETKAAFVTPAGIQVDVRVVEPESYGAALVYFTGSKAHNIALRQRAQQRGWLLNEYRLGTDEDAVAGSDEEGIYEALDLVWIPPPMREDTGEIEAAEAGTLAYVTTGDVRGDLHVHTDMSGDGDDTLEAMLDAAAARGYEYVAITDHAENLTINGVGREAMLHQRERLRNLQDRYAPMRLLHGAELNIDPDGGLDYDADFLAGYDWCVASVHSHFDLPAERQTVRLLTAMGNPAVNAIGHLSGRMIGRRPGIEFDVEAVLEAAEITRTALEINSNLARLDVAADVIRRARDRDVLFVISTDAHRVRELGNVRWGVAQSQRGWARPEQVVNTWPEADFSAWARARRGA